MNRKSEILFVTPRIPAPGVFGDQLRAWNFLKQVAESFEVTLVCLDSGGNEEDRQRLRDGLVKEAVFIPHARPLAAIGAVTGLLRGQPAQVGWFSNRTLERQLAELAATGRFEAAFVQLARMAGAVKALGPVPVVMDFVDALSLQWLRRADRGKGPLSWFNAVEGARMTEAGPRADLSPANGLLDDGQRNIIVKALHDNDWNFTQTAQELGIGRTTLWRKVKKYKLKRDASLETV